MRFIVIGALLFAFTFALLGVPQVISWSQTGQAVPAVGPLFTQVPLLWMFVVVLLSAILLVAAMVAVYKSIGR